ncbi:MAG TPA: MmcQ/YjbR family DNA-binding protein [Caulobacteraceae bacterium]|nr:MmcQ/YjbR family DNA-binding protein [Caulobacteraceae bacterium]
MTAEEFEAACLALPGATRDNPWGHEDVFKVGGRMFAMPDGQGGCMFKATDIAYEALIETGRAQPAPYMARAKWVRLADLAGVDADEVRDWLKTAHAIVAAKLTRAQRRDLGLER